MKTWYKFRRLEARCRLLILDWHLSYLIWWSIFPSRPINWLLWQDFPVKDSSHYLTNSVWWTVFAFQTPPITWLTVFAIRLLPLRDWQSLPIGLFNLLDWHCLLLPLPKWHDSVCLWGLSSYLIDTVFACQTSLFTQLSSVLPEFLAVFFKFLKIFLRSWTACVLTKDWLCLHQLEKKNHPVTKVNKIYVLL